MKSFQRSRTIRAARGLRREKLAHFGAALGIGFATWTGTLSGGVTPSSESQWGFVPAGEFWMGDHSTDGYDDERPRHRVHAGPFLIGKREVTYGEWRDTCAWASDHGYRFGDTGKRGWGAEVNDRHPVTMVNWYDAVKWCNARSEQEGLEPAYYDDAKQSNVYRQGEIPLSDESVKWDASGYRLPTEAEWEKSARGGLEGYHYSWGGSESDFDDPSRANCWPHVRGTAETGSYPANGYGIHDMAGNVWEWCWDFYGPYGRANQEQDRSKRVVRGGGWRSVSYLLRCAARLGFDPERTRGTFGFRVVRSQIDCPASGKLKAPHFHLRASPHEANTDDGQLSFLQGRHSTVSGGMGNTIVEGEFDTIGGGDRNAVLNIEPRESGNGLVGGGSQNKIINGLSSTISGGDRNLIHNASDSVVGGGQLNRIQASGATIGGGRKNGVAPGAQGATIPGGSGAIARLPGQWVYSNGAFPTGQGPGTAQTSLYLLKGQSAGDARVELAMSPDQSSAERLIIPDGSTWAFTIRIVYRTPDSVEGTTSGGLVIEGVIDNTAGKTTFVGLPQERTLGLVDQAEVNVEADDQLDALVIKAKLIAGKTIARWVAAVQTIEVSFR